MRATLDTNVLVSALNFGGVPAMLLDLHTDERFTLCASQAIVEELTRVLGDRFEWAKEDIETTLIPIFSRAEIVEPKITVDTSPDPNDNHILAIVTGDRALLGVAASKVFRF